jgi:hypothetical protein
MTSDPLGAARRWALVVDLMRNRWFSRRWVLQELALSRSAFIRIGDEELPYSDFSDAITVFMDRYEEVHRTSLFPSGYDPTVDARQLSVNTVVQITESVIKSGEGKAEQRMFRLEVLVTSLLLLFEVTDPRDTIFAVLTLANDTQYARGASDDYQQFTVDPRIAPNYQKSLLDVYTDFMHYCIEKSRSLNIICRYWASVPKQASPSEPLHRRPRGYSAEEAMPTWIPFITNPHLESHTGL